MLTSLIDGKEAGARVGDYAKAALVWLDGRDSEAPPALRQPPYYIASFSEEDDDLAQWRAYGGSGPKFSIGFRSAQLASLKVSASMAFRKVSYDGALAAERMNEVFLQRVEKMDLNWGRDPWGQHPPLYAEMNGAIVEHTASFLKHDSVSAEAEWRLISE